MTHDTSCLPWKGTFFCSSQENVSGPRSQSYFYGCHWFHDALQKTVTTTSLTPATKKAFQTQPKDFLQTISPNNMYILMSVFSIQPTLLYKSELYFFLFPSSLLLLLRLNNCHVQTLLASQKDHDTYLRLSPFQLDLHICQYFAFFVQLCTFKLRSESYLPPSSPLLKYLEDSISQSNFYIEDTQLNISISLPLHFMAAQLSHRLTLSLLESKIMAAAKVCLLVLHAHKVIQANKFTCCKINYNAAIHRDQGFIIIRSLSICMNNDDIKLQLLNKQKT